MAKKVVKAYGVVGEEEGLVVDTVTDNGYDVQYEADTLGEGYVIKEVEISYEE